MRYGITAVIVLAGLVVPGLAWADGPQFGAPGQLVISDDQSVGSTGIGSGGPMYAPVIPGAASTISLSFASVSDGGGSGTEFVLAPAADYFVINSLSVGGEILFGTFQPAVTNASSVTTFGIAPRVGYNLQLTDNITFWPKLYLAYATSSAGPQSYDAFAIGVFAPFLYHLMPHLFAGIGPNLSTVVANGSNLPNGNPGKMTELGLQATFGGWFSIGG